MNCRLTVVTVVAAVAFSACGSSAEVTTTSSNQVGQPVAMETSDPNSARRAADSCRSASRTLETAIEAHYAQNQDDIAAAEELLDEGYLEELDRDFFVDFTTDVPAATPVTDGACDFDFDSEYKSAQDAELAEWEARQCWLDQIALEVAVRGYTAEVGSAPASFADIIGIYAEFGDSWSTVELGPNGEIIDLIPGGCDIADNLEVFGEMWVDAPPQCAVDAWTLAWSLHLADGFGDDSMSIEQLIATGLIVRRPYLYQVAGGLVTSTEDSGCPFLESEADDPDEEYADACAVELRVLETAAEAFFAEFLHHPSSIDELVTAEYLSDTPSSWQLEATAEVGSISFEPVSGGRCDLAE